MSNYILDIADVRAHERRLPWRLLMYWQNKRGMRPMPDENEIDPDELGEDWSRCFLLQSRDIHHVADYNYTYLGPKIIQAYEEVTLDAHNPYLVGPYANNLTSHFKRLLDARVPLLDDNSFTTPQGQCVIFRQILLPLGNPNEDIAAIFGGMSYKLVA